MLLKVKCVPGILATYTSNITTSTTVLPYLTYLRGVQSWVIVEIDDPQGSNFADGTLIL